MRWRISLPAARPRTALAREFIVSDVDTATETMRLEVRRLISGSREAVFRAWTTPETMEKFMCPGRRDSARVTCDPRPGGRFTIDMMGDQGQVWHHEGEYLEVTAPSRLKFTWISASTHHRATVVTVDFLDRDGKTEVVLVHEGLPDQKERDGHTVGWTEILKQVDWALAA